jgi:hypothetical protein
MQNKHNAFQCSLYNGEGRKVLKAAKSYDRKKKMAVKEGFMGSRVKMIAVLYKSFFWEIKL